MQTRSLLAIGWLATVTMLTAAGFARIDERSDRVPLRLATAQGAKVTFSTVRGEKLSHTQRARLLSLAVERGETPTPYLPVGAFRARFDAMVTLPARDRMNFRVDGRGKVKLLVNGKPVLDGRLRGRERLETEKAVRLKKGENDLQIEYESAARGDGELRVFWSGYDFGFEPIAPELLSPVLPDHVLHVTHLSQQHRCRNTHLS